MIGSIELFKLKTYEELKKRIRSIDPRKDWKYFKKLIQSEVDKRAIEKEI